MSARAIALGAILCLLCAVWSPNAWSQASGDAVDAVPKVQVVALNGNLELDDIVEVTVTGLAEWTKTQGHGPWRLVPYLNGRALTGLYPAAVNLRTEKLQFYLRMTPENRTSWKNVLSPPTLKRAVRFSVGLELQDPFETLLTHEQNPVTLTVINQGWALVALTIGAIFALCFFWLAVTTPILMERASAREGETVLRYSLAKVQLAVWFFVVFGAFFTIWLATGNYDTLNSSIVATLGISAGTALGDAYIKSRQESGALGAGEMHRPNLHFSHFVRDLLSDSDGYSIYRFQMMAWTVVLTTIFVAGVYYDLAMPEFRPDLLYLLGLSSGTYIAHRFPETSREARMDVEQAEEPAPVVTRSTGS